MLFQLSEIQKQQALIQIFQQSKQNTYDKLIKSYSSNQKSQNSLKQKFQAILKQSALLIHILRQIQQSVQHKNLLPSLFYEKDINKLLYSRAELPEWFQHVFSKQYEKQKINLETVSSKIYKLHGLAQKNAQLVKQHWNMEILLKRYESLNQKELQRVDIIQEVQSFQNLYKSCKQIYTNFLQMISKKIAQFLENTVQSTLIYTNQLKKVKSFDNKHFFQNNKSNLYSQVFLPNKKEGLLIELDSNDTVKPGLRKNFINQKISNYQISSNSGNKERNMNNCSTVQSLREKQKANNQYFFRKAQNRQTINDNSITRQIKYKQPDYTNQYGICSHVVSQNYIKNRQQSKDSSVKSVRSYYGQSNRLKKYQSSSNSITPKNTYTKRYYNNDQQQLKQRSSYNTKKENHSNAKSNNCYHHCPHHDRPLNNHCSKHCNKVCSHEKNFFNNFGIDLVQMNKKYFQNKQKYHKQTLKSVRSNQSQGKQFNNYTSRNKDFSNIYTARQRNIVQNKKYLRNSHDKHIDYYQQKKSPISKQNMRMIGNRPLNPIQNINKNSYSPGKIRNTESLQYNSFKYSKSPPAIRVSEYYFN